MPITPSTTIYPDVLRTRYHPVSPTHDDLIHIPAILHVQIVESNIPNGERKKAADTGKWVGSRRTVNS